MRIISGDELTMLVKMAHASGQDNIYKCRKCGHYICWCCGDVCDYFDHNKMELCKCMNDENGCEVEIP